MGRRYRVLLVSSSGGVLLDLVAAHRAAAARLLAERPLPPLVPDDRLVAILDDLCGRLFR